MGKQAFITKGKARGRFAVRCDDGSLDELNDFSPHDLFDVMGDELDEVLAARGYTKGMRAMEYSVGEIMRQRFQGMPPGLRLDSVVREVAREKKLSLDDARARVLATEQGKELWEQIRKEELEASSKSARGLR